MPSHTRTLTLAEDVLQPLLAQRALLLRAWPKYSRICRSHRVCVAGGGRETGTGVADSEALQGNGCCLITRHYATCPMGRQTWPETEGIGSCAVRSECVAITPASRN